MNENNNTCKNFTPYLGITKKRGKIVSIFQLAKKGKMVVKVIHSVVIIYTLVSKNL